MAPGLLQTLQQQGEHQRSGVGGNDGRRMQIGRTGHSRFAHRLLHPRGAHQHAGFALQPGGKIDDAGTGPLRGLPMPAG